MIFIHSSFRTGSTFIWSRFRTADHAVAYYELFNESLATLTPLALNGIPPASWHSGHPACAPYFLEYLPLLGQSPGVAGFEPDMSYGRFVPAAGCSGELSDAEIGYVGKLVGHAEACDKLPVLTSVRSLGRLRGFKAAAPGLHVMLYRNLFRQWCSFSDQAYRGVTFFIDRIADIVRLNSHDRTIAELQQLFPAEHPSFQDQATFYLFALLHLHLYTQAAGAADLILDLDDLASDPQARTAAEHVIAEHGVAVDLSGAKHTINYSLCMLEPPAVVHERLKVLGDVVIGRAPDAAGAAFGAKVLVDLLAEYDRQEFYTSGLRSVLLGPTGLLSERDRLAGERDAAAAARDAMHTELELTAARRKDLQIDCDRLARECQDALASRSVALAAADEAQSLAEASRRAAEAERAEQAAAGQQRDALRRECDLVASERAAWREWALTGSLLVEPSAPSRPAGIARLWPGNGRRATTAISWRGQGDAARDRGDWLEAARAYDRHLRATPGDAAIWIQLGHVLKEAGRLHPAVLAYERSRLLDPNDAERDLHLANLRERIATSPGTLPRPLAAE